MLPPARMLPKMLPFIVRPLMPWLGLPTLVSETVLPPLSRLVTMSPYTLPLMVRTPSCPRKRRRVHRRTPARDAGGVAAAGWDRRGKTPRPCRLVGLDERDGEVEAGDGVEDDEFVPRGKIVRVDGAVARELDGDTGWRARSPQVGGRRHEAEAGRRRRGLVSDVVRIGGGWDRGRRRWRRGPWERCAIRAVPRTPYRPRGGSKTWRLFPTFASGVTSLFSAPPAPRRNRRCAEGFIQGGCRSKGCPAAATPGRAAENFSPARAPAGATQRKRLRPASSQEEARRPQGGIVGRMTGRPRLLSRHDLDLRLRLGLVLVDRVAGRRLRDAPSASCRRRRRRWSRGP